LDDPEGDPQVMGLLDLDMGHPDTIPPDTFHHLDTTRPLAMVLLGTCLLPDTDHLGQAIVEGFIGHLTMVLGQDTEVDPDIGHQDLEVVPHTEEVHHTEEVLHREVELSEDTPAGLLKDQGLGLQ